MNIFWSSDWDLGIEHITFKLNLGWTNRISKCTNTWRRDTHSSCRGRQREEGRREIHFSRRRSVRSCCKCSERFVCCNSWWYTNCSWNRRQFSTLHSTDSFLWNQLSHYYWCLRSLCRTRRSTISEAKAEAFDEIVAIIGFDGSKFEKWLVRLSLVVES